MVEDFGRLPSPSFSVAAMHVVITAIVRVVVHPDRGAIAVLIEVSENDGIACDLTGLTLDDEFNQLI